MPAGQPAGHLSAGRPARLPAGRIQTDQIQTGEQRRKRGGAERRGKARGGEERRGKDKNKRHAAREQSGETKNERHAAWE